MEQNSETMDGILYVKDEDNKLKFVQIDVTKFDDEYIEDLLDGLLAHSRRNEESVPLDQVIEELKGSYSEADRMQIIDAAKAVMHENDVPISNQSSRKNEQNENP
jgi:hypothetical protein